MMIKNYKNQEEKNSPKSAKVLSAFSIKKHANLLKESLPFSHKISSNKLEISFENEVEFEKFINMIKKV